MCVAAAAAAADTIYLLFVNKLLIRVIVIYNMQKCHVCDDVNNMR